MSNVGLKLYVRFNNPPRVFVKSLRVLLGEETYGHQQRPYHPLFESNYEGVLKGYLNEERRRRRDLIRYYFSVNVEDGLTEEIVDDFLDYIAPYIYSYPKDSLGRLLIDGKEVIIYYKVAPTDRETYLPVEGLDDPVVQGLLLTIADRYWELGLDNTSIINLVEKYKTRSLSLKVVRPNKDEEKEKEILAQLNPEPGTYASRHFYRT